MLVCYNPATRPLALVAEWLTDQQFFSPQELVPPRKFLWRKKPPEGRVLVEEKSFFTEIMTIIEIMTIEMIMTIHLLRIIFLIFPDVWPPPHRCYSCGMLRHGKDSRRQNVRRLTGTRHHQRGNYPLGRVWSTRRVIFMGRIFTPDSIGVGMILAPSTIQIGFIQIGRGISFKNGLVLLDHLFLKLRFPR